MKKRVLSRYHLSFVMYFQSRRMSMLGNHVVQWCMHRSVQHKVTAAHDNDAASVLIEFQAGDFDWQGWMLLDFEARNEQACAILDKCGSNGDALHIKARCKAHNLLKNRISKAVTVEEHVKTIVKRGITLSSLFFIIGPNSLSTNENFHAFEFKALLSKCKEEKKKQKLMAKQNGMKKKQREYLPSIRFLVSDLKDLLCLKLADEFSNMMKGMKEQQLHALWEVYIRMM